MKDFGHDGKSFGGNVQSLRTIFGFKNREAVDDKGPSAGVGLGLGFDSYDGGSGIPTFIDLRLNFPKSKISPFCYADVGYSFMRFDNESEWNRGGVLYGGGVGLRITPATSKPGLFVETGYKRQEAIGIDYILQSYNYGGGYMFYSIPFNKGVSLGLFTFSMGLMF